MAIGNRKSLSIGVRLVSPCLAVRVVAAISIVYALTRGVPSVQAAEPEQEPAGYRCYDPGLSSIKSVRLETVEGTPSVVVRGEIRGADLWLGASYVPVDVPTDDMPVRRVRGEFRESYTPVYWVDKDHVRHARVMHFKLWRFKVDAASCPLKNCRFCRRNGYHMESWEDAWDFTPDENSAFQWTASMRDAARCVR